MANEKQVIDKAEFCNRLKAFKEAAKALTEAALEIGQNNPEVLDQCAGFPFDEDAFEVEEKLVKWVDESLDNLAD